MWVSHWLSFLPRLHCREGVDQSWPSEAQGGRKGLFFFRGSHHFCSHPHPARYHPTVNHGSRRSWFRGLETSYCSAKKVKCTLVPFFLLRNTTMMWWAEVLAVKMDLEEWCCWLELSGLIWTDHKNLAYLKWPSDWIQDEPGGPSSLLIWIL